MNIRCDKAMRRNKERTREMTEFGVPRWRCTGNCGSCICGIIRHKDGTESHVNTMRKGVKYAELYNTVEAGNEKKQQSDHNK